MEILKSMLFVGIQEEEFDDMSRALCLRERDFDKNEVIFHMGYVPHEVGIVQIGSVIIEGSTRSGSAAVLGRFGAGEVFAESYALCKKPMMVSVIAAEKCSVLFLDMDIVLSSKYIELTWREVLLRNMLYIAAEKNLILSSRIFCTTPKSVRGRVLAYLSEEAVMTGSSEFKIPFDRQRMADYLNVDRSALSKELGRMRDEGIIEFKKDRFTIKK